MSLRERSARSNLIPNFKKATAVAMRKWLQSIRADLDKAKDVPDATKNIIDKDQVVSNGRN